jgi:Xaa-Pro aminopeptidase
MRSLGLSAYFCPHKDPHDSEYLADCDQRMAFLSGFKGSNGQMLITDTSALLWTDGRYWSSAEKQLVEGWRMMKIKRDEPTYFEWIAQNLPVGATVGYDPYLLSAAAAEARTKYFQEKGYSFKPLTPNLINNVWEHRPAVPTGEVFQHPESFAGESLDGKVGRVVEKLGTKYLFTGVLDEIAWVLNLRGTDVRFSPVFFAYLLIERADPRPILHLFLQASKAAKVKPYLDLNGVVLHPYTHSGLIPESPSEAPLTSSLLEVPVKSAYSDANDAVTEFLGRLEGEVTTSAETCNSAVYKSIKSPKAEPDIITALKAVKSASEVAGIKACHVQDGLAVVRYLAWLQQELDEGRHWDEYSAAGKLESFRSLGDEFVGLSFETISAVGGNAAVIHYKPEPDSALPVLKSSIYLLDSGGQYWNGTTDITRTVHFGVPTAAEQEAYTRVLLGNLDLERLIWPAASNLSGSDMDVLARRRLWEAGLDYNHSTGHGVGYFLNVHEGPHSISRQSKVALKPGMVVTNEPGYYEAGVFGIRIENVLLVVQHGHSLAFDNFTVAPYDRSLIKLSLLSPADISYIDAYHAKVWGTLSPLLELKGDLLASEWLRRQTAPLHRG